MKETQARPLWLDVRHNREAGDKPHHMANYVLHRMGITRPPVPVEAIARNLGVKVIHKANLGPAGILQSTREEAIMWVNGSDSGVRQRFTIAHELGHLLLHTIGIQFRDHTFGPSRDLKETEANDFAAALLMPLWLLEPIVVGSKRGTEALADLFDVSVAALNVQLSKLL